MWSCNRHRKNYEARDFQNEKNTSQARVQAAQESKECARMPQEEKGGALWHDGRAHVAAKRQDQTQGRSRSPQQATPAPRGKRASIPQAGADASRHIYVRKRTTNPRCRLMLFVEL